MEFQQFEVCSKYGIRRYAQVFLLGEVLDIALYTVDIVCDL